MCNQKVEQAAVGGGCDGILSIRNVGLRSSHGQVESRLCLRHQSVTKVSLAIKATPSY